MTNIELRTCKPKEVEENPMGGESVQSHYSTLQFFPSLDHRHLM